MSRKTKKKVNPIWVFTDENGFYCDFEIPRAALMWDDVINFRESDKIEDTQNKLCELGMINEN